MANNQEAYGYKIVLDKFKWLRGEEASKSPFLIEPNTGRYDVAAKIMLDMGYSKSNLIGKRWPCQVIQARGRNERIIDALKWMVSKAQADTDACVKLITINDDPTIDDEARIKAIQAVINPQNMGLIVTDSSVKPQEVRIPQEPRPQEEPFVRPVSAFVQEVATAERERIERRERAERDRRRRLAQWQTHYVNDEIF